MSSVPVLLALPATTLTGWLTVSMLALLASTIPMIAMLIFVPCVFTVTTAQRTVIGFSALFVPLMLASVWTVLRIITINPGYGALLYSSVIVQITLSILFVKIITAIAHDSYDPYWFATLYLRLVHRFSASSMSFQQFAGTSDESVLPTTPGPTASQPPVDVPARGRHAAPRSLQKTAA